MLSLLGLSALAGGMLFFGTVMAPLVFTHLPRTVAGPFIRAAFPWYYGYCIATAGVALLGFLVRREWLRLIVPAAVLAITAWLWLDLLPALDAMRVAGNTAGFARLHRLSVWLNGAELLAAAVLLARMGARSR